MPEHPAEAESNDRRRLLSLFVNGAIAAMATGMATLLGLFAWRPAARADHGRWIRAGTFDELEVGQPVARLLSFPRADGWHKERARATVFLVRDSNDRVRAMSATCTHLGCQVNWDAATDRFRCPCHGGAFDLAGNPVEGPPPRPLASLPVEIDGDGGAVRVRV